MLFYANQQKIPLINGVYEITRGETITAATGVKNIGDADAGESEVGFYAQLNSGPAIIDVNKIGTSSTPALAPNQYDYYQESTWGPLSAGEYCIQAKVDYEDDVTKEKVIEEREDNNLTRIVQLRVKEPAPQQGPIRIAVDDGYELYVDSTSLVATEKVGSEDPNTGNSWMHAETYPFPQGVTPTDNILIAVKCINTQADSAGVLLDATMPDGTCIWTYGFNSDEQDKYPHGQWIYSLEPNSDSDGTEWNDLEYKGENSTWLPAKKYADYGKFPWDNRIDPSDFLPPEMHGTSAQWLWEQSGNEWSNGAYIVYFRFLYGDTEESLPDLVIVPHQGDNDYVRLDGPDVIRTGRNRYEMELGGSVVVKTGVNNIGRGHAEESRLGLYAKIGGAPEISLTDFIDDCPVNKLDSGEADDYLNIDWIPPAELGVWHVQVKADYGEEVAEEDENNNKSNITYLFVKEKTYPDLTFIDNSLNTATPVNEGDDFDITADYTNIGTVEADKGYQIKLDILHINAFYNYGPEVISYTDTIAANGTDIKSVTYSVPADALVPGGNYTVRLTITYNGIESNTTNNTIKGPLEVVALPDLTFVDNSLDTSTPVDQGDDFTIKADYTNIRSTDADQGYEIKVEIFDQANIDNYGPKVMSYTDTILVNRIKHFTYPVSPNTLIPGDYTVVLTITYNDTELDTANNTIQAPLEIEAFEPQRGPIRITTDDEYDLYVDSSSLGAPVKLGQDRNKGSWKSAEFYNFPEEVGLNDEVLIAVKGHNLTLIAGLLLDATMPDGTYIYTNDSGLCVGEWVCSIVYEEGWNTLNHEDSHWIPVKKYADYGSHTQPHSFYNWGNKPSEMSDTQADWIWEPNGCVHPDSAFALPSLLMGATTVYFRYRCGDTPPTPKPDLIVEDFRIDPETITEGNSSTAYFKIKNQGNAAVVMSLAAVYAEITQNPLPQLSNATRLAIETVLYLGPGQSTGELSVTLGPVSPAGTYKVVVKADDGQPATANGDIPESDETNNLSTVKTLTVTEIPESLEYDIRITTINKYDIYVHTQGLTQPINLTGPGANGWKQAEGYNFPAGIGPNDPLVIAVKGERLANTPDTLKGLMLDANMPDGAYKYTSGEEWVYSLTYEAGWNQVDFNDSHWAPVTEYGDIGTHSPFPTGMQNTSANWIWAGTPNSKIVYFRYRHGDVPSSPPQIIITNPSDNSQGPKDLTMVYVTTQRGKVTLSIDGNIVYNDDREADAYAYAFTDLTEGPSHHIIATISNKNGTDSDKIHYTVLPPSSSPHITITSPPDNSQDPNNNVPITYVTTQDGDVTLYLDKTPVRPALEEHAGEHVYTYIGLTEGLHVLRAEITNANGTDSDKIHYMVLSPQPPLQITITKPSYYSEGPKDLEIDYVTTQDGDVILYLGDSFGSLPIDIQPWVAANVTHHSYCTNLPEGEHKIIAEISNANGTARDEIYYKVVTNSQNNLPKAVASATPAETVTDLAVWFSSTGTSDEDGDDLTYKWDFGDGNTSTQPNPSHIYNFAADYTVTLTVTDDKGGSDSETIDVTVNSAQSQLPEIEITSHKNEDVVSGEITIQVNVQSDIGIERVEFLLDEADIATDHDEPYEVNYDTTSLTNGTHTFKATAYDTLGQSAADSVTVEVDNDEETWLERVLDRKRISEEEFDKMKNCDDVSKATWKDITYAQFISVEYPEDLKEQIRQSLDMLKGISVSGSKFGDLQKIIDHIILSGNSLGTTGHGYPDIRAVSIGAGTWDFSEKYWESRSFSEMDKINFAGCFVHEATHVENKNILKITSLMEDEHRALFIGYLWGEKILAKNGKLPSVQCPNYIEVEHFSDNYYDNVFVDARIHGNNSAKIYIDKLKNAQMNSILTSSHVIYGDFSTGLNKIYYTLKGSWPNITKHSRQISTSKYDFDGLPDKRAWEFEFDVDDGDANYESIIGFSTIDPESIDGEKGEKANRYYVGTKTDDDLELYMLDVYSGNRIRITPYANNLHPEIEPIFDQSMEEGEVLRVPIDATDENSNILKLSTLDPLPAFATMPDEYIIGTGTDIVFEPKDTDVGIYEDITVIVEDEGGLTAEESFDLEVINLNNPPTLNPIEDKTIFETNELSFIVSATDPDKDPLTYSAQNLPEGASFSNKEFTWTPTYDQAGTYTVTFSVSDGELTDDEVIIITVQNKNRPPQVSINYVSSEIITAGESVDFAAKISDDDGDSDISYVIWRFGDGSSSTGGLSYKEITHPFNEPGTYEVTVEAFDKQRESAKTGVTITVNQPNRNPQVTITSILPNPALVGQIVKFTAAISDPDGANDLLYDTWDYGNGVSSMSEGGCSGRGAMTYKKPGDYTVTVKVYDKSGGWAEDTRTIAINAPEVNNAPTLSLIGDKTELETSTLNFTISAADPDRDPLTYSAENLPEGASFSNKEFTWTPTYDQAGAYAVTFSVSDGELTDDEVIIITVQNKNRLPQVTMDPISPNPALVGQTVKFKAAITDPDGEGDISYIRWQFEDTSSTTGGIDYKTRTHTYKKPGTYTVTVETKDKSGSPVIKKTGQITVNAPEVNHAPILSPIGNKTINENQLMEFTISATDQDEGDNLTYSVQLQGSLTQDLPYGVSFTNNTFTWTPGYTQAGTYRFIFKVSDSELTDSEIATIIVQNKNRLPQVTMDPISPNPALVGQTVKFKAAITDPDGEGDISYLMWRFGDGVSATGGIDYKTRTHTYKEPGTFTVTLETKDKSGGPVIKKTETITVKDINRLRKFPKIPPTID